jgi:ATP-dependent Lhr-like helicase
VNQTIAELMQRGRFYFLQAKNLFSKAYPFRNLEEDDILKVGRYMHDRFPRLAWLSEEDEVIIKPRGSRKTMYRYFFNNLSMIPDEKDYLVMDIENEAAIGILQEAFVAEYAKPGVKFTLRGSPWKILNIHNDKIYVKAEDDPTGAIPSWVGEEIPVPYEVAIEVGRIKAQVEEEIQAGKSRSEVASVLSQVYTANVETIERAISELVDHSMNGYPIPTDQRVIVENWDDNVIIHSNMGTLVNRTIARIIGHIISEDTGYPVGVQQDTYMVITQTVGEVDAKYVANLLRSLADSNMDRVMEAAIVKTGLFKRRLINVARKSGALSKFANFSNITIGRLMKSFEGTVIYEEAMKDTLRLDLDIKTTIKVLEQMAAGEIDVMVIDNMGEVTPLGQLGIDSISMKTDIVPPDKITRIILESAKARLYNETRVLGCLGKHDWFEERRVKDFPDKVVCPICGTTEVGVFERTMDDVSEGQILYRRGKKEPPFWWKRGMDSSKLVSIYGRRGAIVASAKRVDFTEAWDILAETEGESDDFFERIIEAERVALKKRFM